MKPLFTVHAGEYLVGSHIEARYPRWNVWLPSKDTGVDLLVTNGCNTKTMSLQVKFSKDFTLTGHNRRELTPASRDYALTLGASTAAKIAQTLFPSSAS